jgi:D-alanyl-D-alanine carboxypeptidase
VVAAALLIIGVAVAYARVNGSSARPVALDAALSSARAHAYAPGASAAIVACGQVVWAGVSGVTEVRSRHSVSNRTLFVVASTTKTVTAAMIMQQVQAGRLSLDAPVARFYPKLPNASRITVRMLLNMTSGLPEYLDSPRISSIIAKDPEHQWTRDEVLADLGSPQFAPGTQFKYTDTNYIVLGGILEQVTGRSVESDFSRRIAKPAGMSSSSFTPTRGGTRRMAHPYARSAGGTLSDLWIHGHGLSDDNWSPVWTDGGLASNAADLARFGDALMGGKLVRPATASEMASTGSNNYGLGMLGQSYDGRWWVGHNGAYGGYESENFTDRSRGITVAVTTDLEQAGDASDSVAEQIWRSVVNAYDNLAKRSRPTLCKSRR